MTDQWSSKTEKLKISVVNHTSPIRASRCEMVVITNLPKRDQHIPRVCPYIGLLSLDSYDISLVLITVVQIPLFTVFDLEDWTVVFRASLKCRVGYDLFTRVF